MTREETLLVTWLLEHNVPEAKAFIPLLSKVTVKSSCKCGCPSMSFNFPVDSPMVEIPADFKRDFIGSVDGMDVGLILFAGQGVLSELEIYSLAGHEQPFGLPSLASLKVE
ncbi:hypothetical protein SAMN05421770_102217 [Granulicella rosea]|uniref:Uncharacterized protein n=2 Tax=Granulicella rosea TaxID=474952 RepID=A0A239H3Y4_9BACT|nr:hypothetical protein SAMN05421770_102217 [Granulicella rosea]